MLRYGQVMGRALAPIEPGDHVHTHNVAYEELALRLRVPRSRDSLPAAPAAPHVSGLSAPGRPRGHAQLHRRGRRQQLRRAHGGTDRPRAIDGEALPPNVDGVVAFPHGEGCGHAIGPDTEQLRAHALAACWITRTSARRCILGLGCEVNQIEHVSGGPIPRRRR